MIVILRPLLLLPFKIVAVVVSVVFVVDAVVVVVKTRRQVIGEY